MSKRKYPFADMKVGDAFDIPLTATSANALAQLCWQNGKRLGRTFSYRTIVHEGVYEVSRLENEADLRFTLKPARRARTKKETAELIDAIQYALDNDLPVPDR